jgi:hypothetical protein
MGFIAEFGEKGLTFTRSEDEGAIAEWAKKQKEAVDDLLDSLDRYFYIKEKISDNERVLSAYEKARDNSFGKEQSLWS